MGYSFCRFAPNLVWVSRTSSYVAFALGSTLPQACGAWGSQLKCLAVMGEKPAAEFLGILCVRILGKCAFSQWHMGSRSNWADFVEIILDYICLKGVGARVGWAPKRPIPRVSI